MDEQSVPFPPETPVPTRVSVPSAPRSFFERFTLMFKAVAIFFISLLLLIPTWWVYDLINEREIRRDSVVREVSDKWASAQSVSAPVLTVPYKVYVRDAKDKITHWERHLAYFLPDGYTASGEIQTQIRHRSIYNVPVYSTAIKASGTFTSLNLKALKIEESDVLWDEAAIYVSISDVRGVTEQAYFRWNDTTTPFVFGLPANFRTSAGINTPVKLSPEATKTGYTFSYQFTIKGTEKLTMIPLARQNNITLTSSWSSPNFDGYILPHENTVNDSGFTAVWKTSDFQSTVPHQWTEPHGKYSDGFSDGSIQNIPGCSTTLVFGATDYQVTTRAVKYAITVIGLTFMMFFFIEVLGRKSVHPFQYILIGIALVIFYTLLLSFSEHIPFNASYALAASMTIGLVTLYSSAILHDKKFSALIAATLVLIYGFIFTILKLEDFSLMVGSLGIFCALAIVMYFSRKVDWSRSKA